MEDHLKQIVKNTEHKASLQIIVSKNKSRFKTRFNQPLQLVLCTYPVISSFVHVCIYFEWFPVWLFLELESFVEYCSGSFRAFLQSDY